MVKKKLTKTKETTIKLPSENRGNEEPILKENIGTALSEKQSNQTLKPNPETMKIITGTSNEALSIDIVFRSVLATSVVVPGTNSAVLITNAMQELKPQNYLEGMLCSQLISLHCLGMDYLKRAEKADMRCHQDPDLNNAVKLLRLQHDTIESLMKLRRNGEQRVVVQHVNVNDGGKAIVNGGDMVAEGRG